MRQDGGINSTLWNDFSERSLHELALKTKALVQAYYTKPEQYAYWDGCSTGGGPGSSSSIRDGSDVCMMT